jgi:hypothetical protein
MSNNLDLSGVSEDAKALAEYLQEVLDRTINIYNSYGLPVPDRTYWTMADPVVDCEQLVVSFIQMYIGSPGDEATLPRRCMDPRSATIHIQIAREVPTVGSSGKAPSAEIIQEYSQLQAFDAWALIQSAAELDAWETSGGFGLGVIATVETSEPEGGFQSTTLTMTSAIP